MPFSRLSSENPTAPIADNNQRSDPQVYQSNELQEVSLDSQIVVT